MEPDVFKALSDKNRLAIVEMLLDGEICACKILEAFSITQPTLSHHMKILQQCGLVSARKVGQWSYYSINPSKISEIIDDVQDIQEKISSKIIVPQ